MKTVSMDEISFVSSVLSRLSLSLNKREGSAACPSPEEEGRVLSVRVGEGERVVIFSHKGSSYTIGPFGTLWKENSAVPIVEWEGALKPLLSALFASIYGEGKWRMEELGEEEDIVPSSISYSDSEGITRRYRMEDMILDSIKRGDLSFLKHYGEMFRDIGKMIEKRNPNEVRNVQNYSIILNTLLRRSAGEAGVSPLLLDTLSSRYGKRIEELSTTYGVERLFREMVVSYATLVRKEAKKEYPEKIRRVLFEIETRYGEELSLSYLSELVSLSPSHLSRFFRKSTGESLVSYIAKVRIERALTLLENPDLKISEISAMTGFQDPSYFSRVFCSILGMRPEKWRREYLSSTR